MTSDASNAAKDIADRIEEGAKSAKSTVESTISKAGGTARDFAARTQDRVHDALDGLPEQAADAFESGRRAYTRNSDAVARRVSKQPLESLLLAGAIGYLVGWAANRG